MVNELAGLMLLASAFLPWCLILVAFLMRGFSYAARVRTIFWCLLLVALQTGALVSLSNLTEEMGLALTIVGAFWAFQLLSYLLFLPELRVRCADDERFSLAARRSKPRPVRRFQFSLKSLLIVTTVVAVLAASWQLIYPAIIGLLDFVVACCAVTICLSIVLLPIVTFVLIFRSQARISRQVLCWLGAMVVSYLLGGLLYVVIDPDSTSILALLLVVLWPSQTIWGLAVILGMVFNSSSRPSTGSLAHVVIPTHDPLLRL